jgi:hypothetical protein
MTGGEFLDQAGYSRKLVSWDSVGNDKHSAMGTLVIEESNREPDEIIPVSGHQTSFFRSCKLKLFLIRYLTHPSLVSTERVNSSFSKYFGNLWRSSSR